MKDYFKRLKTHAGIDTAIMVTILGTLAGAGNMSLPVWQGGLFGFIFGGGIAWSIVLITNFKDKE